MLFFVIQEDEIFVSMILYFFCLLTVPGDHPPSATLLMAMATI